jgi:hypothetical protein
MNKVRLSSATQARHDVENFVFSPGEELPQMRKLCTVQAELKDMLAAIETKEGPRGKYWEMVFSVIVRFGGTSMRAWIEWKENVMSPHISVSCPFSH